MTVKRAGKVFYVKVDTDNDRYDVAGTFVLEHVNDATKQLVRVDAEFEEVTRETDGRTSTVSEAVSAGGTSVHAAGDIAQGDVFEDPHGEKYYVCSAEDGALRLRRPLVNDLHPGDVLTEAGNTGVYMCPLSIDQEGEYTIIVRNPEAGMQNTALSVTIEEERRHFKSFV
jgi:hypothetical protein